MKRLIVLGLLVAASQSYATDLSTVYQTAVTGSPILRSDQATQNVASASADINRGSLLPQASLNAGVAAYDNDVQSQTYSASVSQILFDVNTWETWRSAKQTAAAAAATYQYQQQQFIIEVANAYFAVLQADDGLSFAKAQLASDQSLLKQTQEKYAVGLSTVADVKQAQADYDQARATLISNEAAVQTAIESLTAYTGQRYTDLAPLRANLPFAMPEPQDMDFWVGVARAHNFNLQSAHLTTVSDQQNVIAQAGSMIPSISLSASYTRNQYNGDSNDIAADGFGANSTDRAIAITATWDLFATPALTAAVGATQGGNTALIPSALQAQYNYEAQQATEDNTLRQLVADVRQDYLNLMADVRSVAAYKQSVISSQASLEQYQAQYRVGTQTITAVLQQAQDLYQAKQNYSQAQYQYLTDLLQLKWDSGTLSGADIQQLNGWLQG